jgi:hypothetical protein
MMMRPPTVTVQVSSRYHEFFRKILSTNIRNSLHTSEIEHLNYMAAEINQGKTDQSPRCHSEIVGFSLTPTLRHVLPPTTVLNFAPICFNGVSIMAFLPSTPTGLLFLDLVAEDTFSTTGLSMIDEIRVALSNSLLRKLDAMHPEIVKFFGQKNLLSLLSLQKREIKAVITIFGHMISNDFSESDILKDFWSLLMKWLTFSRFTESLVALITNMIQFPDGRRLVISDSGLEELKQLLQEITPVPSTTLPGVSISSEDEIRRFVENMRFAVFELMQFSNAVSGHVRSTKIFDGHITAIEGSLKEMEKLTPPKKTSKNMKLFNLDGLSKLLGSSGSKDQISQMVCEMLGEYPKYSNLSKFFQAGHGDGHGRGTFFIGKIWDLRIECLEKQRLEMEARNRLTEATIQNQKLQRKLMRQKFKTEKQAFLLAAPGSDIRATIGYDQAQTAPLVVPSPVQAPVDLRVRLDSELSSKRVRPEQFSEVQPPKRPAIGDIRAGLVDIRTGLVDLRTGLVDPRAGQPPKRYRQ